MSLKIKYLDGKKSSNKNKAIFIHPDTKMSGFKGEFDDKINQNSNGFLQSIGHYWRWASNYCCGSHSEAGKVMGLAAFGKSNKHNNLKILSTNKDGLIKLQDGTMYVGGKQRYLLKDGLITGS